MEYSRDHYQYELPDRLIAQTPADRREKSRLMCLFQRRGTIEHRMFEDLPAFVQPGDLLVINDTKVIPARFFLRRQSGGQIEGLFLHRRADGEWIVMLKNAGRCQTGERLEFRDKPDRGVRLRENVEGGHWRVAPDPETTDPLVLLEEVGLTPLPPYIRRPNGDRPDDRHRYQTVYATRPGAVAAPTAGLHFTPRLLSRLGAGGVNIVRLTLHVGPGTFAPVKADDLRDHTMHREWYELTDEAVTAIRCAQESNRRVIAVGTTSVRVLETVARRHAGRLVAESGWTDLFLYPPAEFHVVDGLITNFHLPASTLLMLVAAFCDPGGTSGIEMILSAYRQAVENDYRFYSYGDAMLIL